MKKFITFAAIAALVCSCGANNTKSEETEVIDSTEVVVDSTVVAVDSVINE